MNVGAMTEPARWRTCPNSGDSSTQNTTIIATPI